MCSSDLRFFSCFDEEKHLAKTIVYNLNPRDNDLIVTNLYNFNDGSVPGKMQYGAAWWFLDQYKGIENQLNSLSSLGLLSRFVGMLTDSRSFLLKFSRVKNIKKIVISSLLIGTLLISQGQSALTIGDLPYNKEVKGVHLTGLSNMATVNKVNTFIFEEMENVYLINADNPVDAISGGVFIGITKGAIVLVKNNKIWFFRALSNWASSVSAPI